MELNHLIKKFFLSSFVKFISSLGVIFFNILIIYLNDKSTLGLISSALSLIVFLSIFTKFGLNLATLKLTSIFYENRELNKINHLILQTVLISGIISLFFALGLIFFEDKIAIEIYKNEQIKGIIKIFAISLPFFTFLQLQKSLFKSFKKPELSSLSDIGSILFFSCILILASILIGINLTSYRIAIFFLFACIVIFSLNNFILFYIILKNYNIVKINKFSFLKNNLVKSLPDYFSIDLVNYVNVWGCIFFCSFFFSSSIVGSFSSVYWLSYSLLFFPLILNSIYAPYYAIVSKQKNRTEEKKLFYQNRNLSFLITLPIFLILFLFSNFFLEFIFKINSSDFNLIFKILLLNSFMRIIFGPQNLFLNMSNQQKDLNKILIICTFIQILLILFSLIFFDLVYLSITFFISNLIKHIWLRKILFKRLKP
jgi:O-antigen/teichoic acid export membrane protein